MEICVFKCAKCASMWQVPSLKHFNLKTFRGQLVKNQACVLSCVPLLDFTWADTWAMCLPYRVPRDLNVHVPQQTNLGRCQKVFRAGGLQGCSPYSSKCLWTM